MALLRARDQVPVPLRPHPNPDARLRTHSRREEAARRHRAGHQRPCNTDDHGPADALGDRGSGGGARRAGRRAQLRPGDECGSGHHRGHPRCGRVACRGQRRDRGPRGGPHECPRAPLRNQQRLPELGCAGRRASHSCGHGRLGDSVPTGRVREPCPGHRDQQRSHAVCPAEGGRGVHHRHCGAHSGQGRPGGRVLAWRVREECRVVEHGVGVCVAARRQFHAHGRGARRDHAAVQRCACSDRDRRHRYVLRRPYPHRSGAGNGSHQRHPLRHRELPDRSRRQRGCCVFWQQ